MWPGACSWPRGTARGAITLGPARRSSPTTSSAPWPGSPGTCSSSSTGWARRAWAATTSRAGRSTWPASSSSAPRGASPSTNGRGPRPAPGGWSPRVSSSSSLPRSSSDTAITWPPSPPRCPPRRDTLSPSRRPIMHRKHRRRSLLVLVFAWIAAGSSRAAEPTAKVTASWDKVTRVSQTTPTLQVVVNPPLRRGTPVHDNAFKALRDLQADYVRYVPWLPYPKLGVAELEPPEDGKTSWDFSTIDPMTIDFLEATKGHSVILNFSTIPQWMYKTDTPVPYPADPNQVTWEYEKGTELRDPSMKEVAGYD